MDCMCSKTREGICLSIQLSHCSKYGQSRRLETFERVDNGGPHHLLVNTTHDDLPKYRTAVQVDFSQVGFQISGFGLCFNR